MKRGKAVTEKGRPAGGTFIHIYGDLSYARKVHSRFSGALPASPVPAHRILFSSLAARWRTARGSGAINTALHLSCPCPVPSHTLAHILCANIKKYLAKFCVLYLAADILPLVRYRATQLIRNGTLSFEFFSTR